MKIRPIDWACKILCSVNPIAIDNDDDDDDAKGWYRRWQTSVLVSCL